MVDLSAVEEAAAGVSAVAEGFPERFAGVKSSDGPLNAPSSVCFYSAVAMRLL